MTKEEWYRQLFQKLGNSKFRSSFHLKQKDIDYINEKGMDTIRQHARDFMANRNKWLKTVEECHVNLPSKMILARYFYVITEMRVSSITG